MKNSTLGVILLWMMGISFLGYIFLETNNMVINTSSIFFILIIDMIAIFSVFLLGISRWFIEAIDRLIQDNKKGHK